MVSSAKQYTNMSVIVDPPTLSKAEQHLLKQHLEEKTKIATRYSEIQKLKTPNASKLKADKEYAWSVSTTKKFGHPVYKANQHNKIYKSIQRYGFAVVGNSFYSDKQSRTDLATLIKYYTNMVYFTEKKKNRLVKIGDRFPGDNKTMWLNLLYSKNGGEKPLMHFPGQFKEEFIRHRNRLLKLLSQLEADSGSKRKVDTKTNKIFLNGLSPTLKYFQTQKTIMSKRHDCTGLEMPKRIANFFPYQNHICGADTEYVVITSLSTSLPPSVQGSSKKKLTGHIQVVPGSVPYWGKYKEKMVSITSQKKNGLYVHPCLTEELSKHAIDISLPAGCSLIFKPNLLVRYVNPAVPTLESRVDPSMMLQMKFHKGKIPSEVEVQKKIRQFLSHHAETKEKPNSIGMKYKFHPAQPGNFAAVQHALKYDPKTHWPNMLRYASKKSLWTPEIIKSYFGANVQRNVVEVFPVMKAEFIENAKRSGIELTESSREVMADVKELAKKQSRNKRLLQLAALESDKKKHKTEESQSAHFGYVVVIPRNIEVYAGKVLYKCRSKAEVQRFLNLVKLIKCETKSVDRKTYDECKTNKHFPQSKK